MPLNYDSSVIRDVIDRLQRPIPDLPTLLALLSGPLDCLGLLPPQLRIYNREPLPSGSVDVFNHISYLQRALLDYIAPTWDVSLQEEGEIVLLDQYFCPDSYSCASSTAENVVLIAYASILSQPLTKYGIALLARISKEYHVDRLHATFFAQQGRESPPSSMLGWEDYVRNIVMVPAKVANALAGNADVPPSLEHGLYFNNLCLQCECLLSSLSKGRNGASFNADGLATLFNRTTTRCCTFCDLFIRKTCKCGSLPRRSANISFAAILFRNDSKYDSCSTTCRRL